MKVFLILLAGLLLIALVLFIAWFVSTLQDGNCPLCALGKIKPSKFTIDTSDLDDYSNGATAPIMGWSSWNTLRNKIDEDTIYEMAVAMKETGLSEAGYKYINIDDCWQSSERDEDGKLQGDLETFPSGIPVLVKKINALDLKVGLYTSNGTLTCEDLPASLGNEVLDARTLASWGVEYFKYDFCHNKAISGDSPAIECVDISLPGERAFTTLTPDMAEFTGKAKVLNIKDLPSKKAFGLINHGAGTATFEVDAPQAGMYVLTIHFLKLLRKHKQYVQVTVNGKVHEVFYPEGTAFTPEGRMQLKVQLNQGSNTIMFANPITTRADSAYTQYMRMGNALKDATADWAMFTKAEEKPIYYSICEWGFAHPWNWGAKAGNMWRTTMDIKATWKSIYHIYKKNVKLYKSSSPGHYNDPDMLEVGNGKLTFEENRSHFALWCMMAAPLVLGNDLRNLTNGSEKSRAILNIVTNNSLILIDQDPLAKAAKIIKTQGGIDVLARPLQNGDAAVCFFNKTGNNATISFSVNELCNDEYVQLATTTDYDIHDLWNDDRIRNDEIKVTIPKHATRIYRISAY